MALKLFSMPNRSSSAIRACSALSSLKRMRRPRSSEYCSNISGSTKLRSESSCSAVRRRSPLGSVGVPVQVIGRADRLAVFIKPYEREIEIISRKIEVVRIASEKSRLEFRREHEPHV